MTILQIEVVPRTKHVCRDDGRELTTMLLVVRPEMILGEQDQYQL